MMKSESLVHGQQVSRSKRHATSAVTQLALVVVDVQVVCDWGQGGRRPWQVEARRILN